jgi:eukaryotic-like serine/threonine-protein kinase
VTIKLEQGEWEIGPELGSGGFGQVRQARSDDVSNAVAKFVPIDPGADRELLIGDALMAAGLSHVVPVLDSGQVLDEYVLIMPRADYSLREHLESVGRQLDLDSVILILSDVAQALAELDLAGIVHRDLKPDNVLYLDGSWRLCDFGIARYRDASTATHTRKHAKTRPYAAPEQWREERATSATDVYAFGVMAYEMLSGQRPFLGPDFRDEHLHKMPPALTVGTLRLRLLVEECLEKPSGARPTPTQLVRRLASAAQAPAGSGAQKLAAATKKAAERQATENAERQRQASDRERREALFQVAFRTFAVIPASLMEALQAESPLARVASPAGQGQMEFVAELGAGKLGVSKPSPIERWNGPFEVIAVATITVNQPPNNRGYDGRSHSLWYSDPKAQGAFAWYELAFMRSAFVAQPTVVPFAAQPQEVPNAFARAMGTEQLAWPIEELDRADLTEFVDRWLGWFADAAEQELHHPSQLPEKSANGGYRGA